MANQDNGDDFSDVASNDGFSDTASHTERSSTDNGRAEEAAPTVAAPLVNPAVGEQGFDWEQTDDSVTIRMPFKGNPRTLAVHTDGVTLKVSWDLGSLVIDLYARILEDQTGPARLRQGVFQLPMKKAVPEQWPTLEKAAETEQPASSGSFFDSIVDTLSCAIPCVGAPPEDDLN